MDIAQDTVILAPGDPGWDDARQAWNLAVDQHPAAIALPASARGVKEAIRFARERGLRVAAQGPGHNPAPLGSLAGTVLVKTSMMRHVTVGSEAKIARAEAGAAWGDVTDAAAAHGLAALAGSAPSVGVAGYTLGGGISWLGRSYGLAANNVEAIELVTADLRHVRADACAEPDLFWALRGGGGSFGVVTAIELRLFPITEVYAGQLWWPAAAALPVLHAWRGLTQGDLPDEFTSSALLATFPQLAGIPEQLSGRSFVILTVVHLGAQAEADTLLAPLRALRPVTDTIATIPAKDLGHLHTVPEQPVPTVGDGLMLAGLTGDAVETLVRVAGPQAGSPLLATELIHLGGEMKRARPGNGALAAVNAEYALMPIGLAPTPQAGSAVARSLAAVHAAMRPWAAPQMYLNLACTRRDPAGFWPPPAYDRLRRIKAAVDPGDLIRSNHPVPC